MNTQDVFELISTIIDILSVSSLVARVIPTHRECTVELSNGTSNYSLCNPSLYIKNGNCLNPLPPAIQPTASATTLFSKTAYGAHGSVGLFTYDLCDASKTAVMKIAVMFKVPFNRKKHPNMYGVGLFDPSAECGRELYQEMAKSIGTFVSGKAKGPSLSYKSQDVSIRASMSDCYTPVLMVQVSED